MLWNELFGNEQVPSENQIVEFVDTTWMPGMVLRTAQFTWIYCLMRLWSGSVSFAACAALLIPYPKHRAGGLKRTSYLSTL